MYQFTYKDWMRFQNATFKDRLRLMAQPTRRCGMNGWKMRYKIMDGDYYLIHLKKIWR